ncbi:MAG: HK97 family phage prohead protease [Anaerolinea sp.]|nr:HK97 family phage prohead protease [Anaerolinea sp.]
MNVNLFAKFTKSATSATEEERIVVGIASSETLDNQPGEWDGKRFDGDVIDPAAIEEALDGYMAWANIREMHAHSAVGTAVKAEVVDGKLQITARVVDDTAWEKVKAGVYKGFSIGGRIVDAVLENLPDGRIVRRILKLLLSEISLVDRPANPDARILLWKMEARMTIDELWTLMKGAADPAKIITLIQAARNQTELDGDLPGAELYTQAIALVMQASGEVEAPEAEAESELSDGAALAEGAGDLAMSANAGNLRKAGRKISSGNIAAMHKVLKALIDMMSAAGDETAMKLQAAYGLDKTAVSGAGDVAKLAGETAVKPVMDQLLKVGDILATIEGRLTTIEKQPVGGGPILRQTEKRIAVQTAATSVADYETVYKSARIDELKRLAATEPHPGLRANYQHELDQLLTSANGQAK